MKKDEKLITSTTKSKKVIKYYKFLGEYTSRIQKLEQEIEELKEIRNTESQKKNNIQEKVRKFIEWLRDEHQIYVENIFLKLGFEETLTKKRNKRVSSVINIRDSFNDTKGSQLFKNLNSNCHRSEAEVGHNSLFDRNIKLLHQRPFISPCTSYSGLNSFVSDANLDNNLKHNQRNQDQVGELLLLRRELRKETELISKLKKLLMDTSHPSFYEYKQWPNLKHVWRWVKQLTKLHVERTDQYIS